MMIFYAEVIYQNAFLKREMHIERVIQKEKIHMDLKYAILFRLIGKYVAGLI